MLHIAKMDKRRDGCLLSLLLAQDGADAGALQIAVHGCAAHHMHITFTVFGSVGVHRPNHRELVGVL